MARLAVLPGLGVLAGLALLAVALSGCGSGGGVDRRAAGPGGGGRAARSSAATASSSSDATVVGTLPSGAATSTTLPKRSAPTRAAAVTTTVPPVLAAPPSLPEGPNGGPISLLATGSGPLNGKVIAVDPGHNGGNFASSSINSTVWNGREQEACDTTGTETAGGYTEAQFNFNVAEYLTADLRAEGAKVVLTRTSNAGVGPCVTQRAAIGNEAHADAAISIHADGGPSSGRGFAILEPVADGTNDAIVGPSATLGTDLRNAFATGTGELYSTYDGVDAIQPRDDLGGINLSTVPKVFVECANMRNSADAALVVSPRWQQQAARALAAGFVTYLSGTG